MIFRRLFASHKRPYVIGLNNPERIRVNIAGCELQLTLPPHYSSEGFDEKVPPRDISNIYDLSLYDSNADAQPFSQTQFIRRDWSYFGPFWKLDDIGMTDFMATVMRVNCLPEGMSCLNPNHLEQVMMRFLYRLGPEMPEFAHKLAPINWRVEDKQGNPWVVCEEHRKRDSNIPVDPSYAVFDSFAITALDDHHVIKLSFGNFGSLPVDDSIAACNKIRDKVLDSIHWTLSPSLQARKEAVLQQFPNTHINQHRNPEPWIYPTWRDGAHDQGEPDVVILEPGSAAPVFIP